MRLGIIAIVLAACSPTMEMPSTQSPPPVVAPERMILDASEMTPGASFTLSVQQADPGDRVYFGYSVDGLGASPPLAALGGLQLDLVSPQLVPGTNPALANGAGEASITFTIPPGTPSGFTAAVQAAVADGPTSYLSNALLVEVDGCAADANEEDDVYTTANLTDYEQLWRGRGCIGDLDWFSIDVHADAMVEVDLSFLHADGDLDLFLFDGPPPPGALVAGAVASAESGTDDEQLAYSPSEDTTLYIAVSTVDDGANGPGNRYDLRITEATATPFDRDGDGLPNTFELAHTSPPSLTALSPSGDPDGDGLSNAEEYDAGTDPTADDTDLDGAGDWYELVVAFTDPLDGDDAPVSPYPLPAPDGSTGVTDRPVKVYILTGQSNMVGFGRVDGPEPGTLESLSKLGGKFPNLVDDATGDWAEREDVLYRGVIGAIGEGPLAPGFAANANSFGPELGFGHVMGWYHDEPVLILKASLGGLSLGGNLLPPGSEPYTVGNTTYAGFGDSPLSWPAGTTPVATDAYGGDHFDRCFRDEADHAAAGGDPVFNVTDVLDDFAAQYPQWADQGFEIAGFAWWQGWNDGLSYTSHYANRYEQNLVGFIEEVRDYYEDRYPNNIAVDAPFVVATSAFDGFVTAYPTRTTVAEAQLAVDGDSGNYPGFQGNVRTMEARGYWREDGPSGQNYHYHHHAETFLFTGDALARGMIDLLTEDPVAPVEIDAVYLAQTHVQKPTDAYLTLVGDRDTLIKAHVVGPGGTVAPTVSATLSLDGQTLTLPMSGPAILPESVPDGPGVVEHTEDDAFLATIPRAWMKRGLTIDVQAGSASTVLDDLDIGAPTHLVMRMFDIHFFSEKPGDYDAGLFEEFEAKLPVADLEIRRLPRVIFPQLVIPPRGGAPAARVSSAAEYLQETGLVFDGEQGAALNWRGALQEAAGRSRQHHLYYINIYQTDSATTGGQAGGFGGVGCICTGVFHHELGHALSLPHWGNSATYPYSGTMHGIPAPSQTVHVGPTWAYDLRLQRFIPPTVQPGNAGNQPVGTYKVDPMQGGGSGFQEPGFLLNHFSDYSVWTMQGYLERHMAVWNADLGAYARWSDVDGDYTSIVSNNGVQHPVERDVEVISIMAAVSGANPGVTMAYPPIGPYETGMTTLFDPRVPADRAAAQAIFSPAGGSDVSVRVQQGGVDKIYMLAASWDPGADPLSGNSLQTAAINLPAADGEVSRIELLLTPDAEINGLPAQPQVLDTWAALLPDPSSFDELPAAYSSSAITMKATAGAHADGEPVEYLFTETTGNPGGTSSGWQSSPSYTDIGLTPGTTYTYTVSMRAGTAVTGASDEASATTRLANGSDTIVVDGTQQFSLQNGGGSKPVTGLGTFDAAGSDKLVVVVSTEHGFNNGAGAVLSVTYNGLALTRVIEEDAGSDRGSAAIYYLDNPGAIGAGTLEVSASNPNGGIGAAYALSGTAPGYGATASVTGSDVDAVDLVTAGDNSLVIAVLENSGNPNGAGSPTVLAPLTQVSAGTWGSQWGSHASGHQTAAAPGMVMNPFMTNTGSGYSINVAAAEFPAAELP